MDRPSEVSEHWCDWVRSSGDQAERALGKDALGRARERALQVTGGPPAQASHVALAPVGWGARGQAAWGCPFLNLGCFVIASGP